MFKMVILSEKEFIALAFMLEMVAVSAKPFISLVLMFKMSILP